MRGKLKTTPIEAFQFQYGTIKSRSSLCRYVRKRVFQFQYGTIKSVFLF